eukprot:tig00000836_g4701.t1
MIRAPVLGAAPAGPPVTIGAVPSAAPRAAQKRSTASRLNACQVVLRFLDVFAACWLIIEGFVCWFECSPMNRIFGAYSTIIMRARAPLRPRGPLPFVRETRLAVLRSHLARGAFFIFLGLITWNWEWYGALIGFLVIFLGVLHLIAAGTCFRRQEPRVATTEVITTAKAAGLEPAPLVRVASVPPVAAHYDIRVLPTQAS